MNSQIDIVIKKASRPLDYPFDEETMFSIASISSDKYTCCGFVDITIKDNGVGISSENLIKVFGEFNQFDPHKLQGTSSVLTH